MALVIETGSIVANANSYGETDATATIAKAIAYAADRGIVLADNAVISSYLVRGTDYIESRALEFLGSKVNPDQSLSFPRTGLLKSDGSAFPSDELPPNLLKALYQLCIEQFNGIVLMPTIDPATGGFIIREKVDVIETEYSEKLRTGSEPTMPLVESLLASLLFESSAFFLRTVRV